MQKRCYNCMNPLGEGNNCPHCGFPTAARNESHQLPMGTILREQYLIGKVLGQGGFGITYLGWDLNLETPVAIKEYFPSGQVNRNAGYSTVVTATQGGDQFREGRDRFLREARTLARLRRMHNIVQVHTFFAENNTAYIVMEYVEGITLQEYMRRRGGRLTPNETFTILRPVMKALGQVHQEGLIHRDVSPDNIMLQNDGTVKILDFGTARDVDLAGDGQLAHSTQAVLKYGFAPAEQYASGRAIDLRADEYAFCSTIYYCLTGKTPPDAFQRLMDGTPMPWNQVPGLTPEQIQVLAKGTAVRAEDRYPNMESLELALFGNNGATSIPEGPIPTMQKPNTSSTVVPPAFVPPSGYGPSAFEPSGYGPSGNGPMGYGPSGNTPAGFGPSGVSGDQFPFTAPMPPQPKPKKKKKWLIPVIASAVAVLVLVVLVGVAGGGSDPAPSAPAAAAEAETVPTESRYSPTAWRQNQMMSDLIESHSGDTYYVLGSEYERSDIVSLTFTDNLDDVSGDSWDVSKKQDGSVMAWVEKSGSMYHLYIGAEGGVRAPSDCEDLFRYYENMKEIRGLEYFHVASDVTNMLGMFGSCYSLKSIDMTSWDLSGVTSLRLMFSKCSSLAEIRLEGLDTSNVGDFAGIFETCTALTSIDLSSWNTGNATNFNSLFWDCANLESINLDGWETGKVTDMGGMFAGCESLKSLDLSHFDTSNVKIMRRMFRDCYALGDLELGEWDTSSVTENVEFMGEDGLYKGKPWKRLF